MKYARLVYLVEKDMNAMTQREAEGRPSHRRPTRCSRSRQRAPSGTERQALATGHFAGTKKNQLGGFMPIAARDLNDAMHGTGKLRMARRGRGEVRPIKISSREEEAMKFMFMIYHDEDVLAAVPEGERQTRIDAALDYIEEIRRSGHYIVSNALQPARTARTIRVRGSKVSTTDGPFAETKEQIGGFFLIEARDMDEACEVASRFPPARVGTIEVRPVRELRHSQLGRRPLV